MSSSVELKFVRLKNKEDFVAEIIPSNTLESNVLRVRNPLKVVYFVNSFTGKIGLNYQEWIFRSTVSEVEFDIPKSEVLLETYPSDQMIEAYYRSLDKIEETYSDDGMEVEEESMKDYIDRYVEAQKEHQGLNSESSTQEEEDNSEEFAESQSEFIKNLISNTKYTIH